MLPFLKKFKHSLGGGGVLQHKIIRDGSAIMKYSLIVFFPNSINPERGPPKKIIRLRQPRPRPRLLCFLCFLHKSLPMLYEELLLGRTYLF